MRIRAALLLTLWAGTAPAQDVTGTVRSAAGRTPVAGAIVLLVDPAGTRAAATLTDDGGRFRLRAPSAGTFGLRVDVVGYRSMTVPPFALGAADTAERDVTFAFERTQLPAVAVTATSNCARVSGDAGDAPRLWSEAQKTLEASRLAIQERRFNAALRRFERTIGIPDSVLRASRTWNQTGVTQNGCGRGDDAGARALGGHGIRRGEPPRALHPRAHGSAHFHCPSGLPGRAHARREDLPLTRTGG